LAWIVRGNGGLGNGSLTIHGQAGCNGRHGPQLDQSCRPVAWHRSAPVGPCGFIPPLTGDPGTLMAQIAALSHIRPCASRRTMWR